MRRPFIYIAVVLMSVGVFFSGSRLPEPSSHEAADERLVVVTYNIGGRSAKKASGQGKALLKDVIGEHAPDLVFLQECGKKESDSLAAALGMEHSLHIPYQVKRKRKSGLAILSRFPLRETETRYFQASPNGLGYVMCEAMVGGRPLRLVNLHLDRNPRVRTKKVMPRIPWKTALGVVVEELTTETVRCRQVDMILDRLNACPAQNTIIAGDFNTIPYATATRKVQARFQDALWPSMDYFTHTYREIGFPFKPRIDYIFHSPEITRTDSGVIRSGPGDHHAVWAGFIVG